jgi:hypothetical protein
MQAAAVGVMSICTVSAAARLQSPEQRRAASRILVESYTIRYLPLAAITAVAALAVTGSISPAAAEIDYPRCVRGTPWGYPGNCQFSTYQQCQATASGVYAYCAINPRFADARPRPGYYAECGDLDRPRRGRVARRGVGS